MKLWDAQHRNQTSHLARIGVIVLTFVLYVGFSLLHYPDSLSEPAAFAILPVALSAWLMGVPGGLGAGVLVMLLNPILLYVSGERGLDRTIFSPDTAETLIALMVGLVVGWLRDTREQVRAQATEYQRIQQETHEQRVLSDALRDIVGMMVSTLDIDQVFHLILSNVWRVVPHDAANIMVIEGDRARIVAWRGYKEADITGMLPRRFKIRTLQNLREMFETGTNIVIPDTHKYPHWVHYETTTWISSYVAAPIRMKGEVIGFLNLDGATPGLFTAADGLRLQFFADQAAVAIHNARLYDQIQRRQRYLEIQRRIGLRAAPERDPARLMRAVAEALAEEFNYPIVSVMLGDEVKREMIYVAIAGEAADRVTPPADFKQSYDTGIAGLVFREGRPYLAHDVTTDPHYVAAPGSAAISSEMSVPIMRYGQVAGVLTAQSFDKDAFDELDLQAVAELSTELAIDLENTRLNRQIAHHAEELEQRVMERTAELRAAKDRLEELDRLKSKFVADVSHELRTPVANLSLYVDLLQNGPRQKHKAYVEVVGQQVARLSALVESILNLTRLELGRGRVEHVSLDLNQIAGEAVTAFGPRAETAGLRLIFEPQARLPRVVGEPSQLGQVVSNLLSNAIQYTPSGEVRLTTGLDASQGQAVLTVSDTGIGIDADDMPHVFDRFYRGRHAAESSIPGTGLGLSIVKEIVDLHGGSIRVESSLDRGSAFMVRLPLNKLGH